MSEYSVFGSGYYGGGSGYNGTDYDPYTGQATGSSVLGSGWPSSGEVASTAPNSQSGQPQNGAQSQTKTSDWLSTAKWIYDIYKSKNPDKPNFAPVPLSPEQKQIHELYLKTLMNPATKDNAAQVNDIARQQLKGLSGMKWTSPKTFSGEVGYSGSNIGFTPPWGPSGSLPDTTTPSTPTPYTPENGYNSGNTTVDATYEGGGPTAGGPMGGDASTHPFDDGYFADPHGEGQDVGELFNRASDYLDNNPDKIGSVVRGGIGVLGSLLGIPLVGTLGNKLYNYLANKYGWNKQREPGDAPEEDETDPPEGAPPPPQREDWGPDWAARGSMDFFGGLGSQEPGANTGVGWTNGGMVGDESNGGNRYGGKVQYRRGLR